VQSVAWALGGWAGYKTGWIADALQFGVVGYTSQRLWGPEDKGGTGLLVTPQDPYSVVGQAYVSLKLWDQLATGGRFIVDQPEINPHDIRMTPITYQGGLVSGAVGGLNYYGAYLDGTKPRTSEKFLNFVEAANIDSPTSEPLWLLTLGGEPIKGLGLRVSSYYVANVLSSTFTDVQWLTTLSGGDRMRLSAQGMYQTSVGDDLLQGKPFNTYSMGLKADYMPGAATLTLAYQQTGRGSNYNKPYAGWAGYPSMIVKDFDLAGQQVWLIAASYDFAALRAPGFMLGGGIASGNNAINPSTEAPQPNWTEYDLTADYRFSAKTWPEWTRPFWLRGRVAYVDMGANGVINDYRIILNYEWVFK
ncbi:MAG: OprD family outer membrane porin, partial [Burkholderiales bacterium]